MKEFSYTIRDEAGIHIRPAGLFVKLMQGYSSSITLSKGDKKVDAKKLFMVMSLAVRQGENITVSAEGGDEQESIDAAAAFLKENL